MEHGLLAVDQGTSGTKAVIFDERARLVAKGFAELRSYYPRHGFVEQRPEEIHQSALAAVKKCADAFKANGGDLETVRLCGISNQRETFLLWDERGEPLHNAVVWQCKRSVEICARLKNTPQEGMIAERTGLMVDPYFSGTKVKWLYENVEPLQRAIDRGEALGGTVDAWLLYRLTGGRSYCTDYTNASRTLFFNIDKLAWDDELLRAFGLQSLRLPQACPSAYDYGETTFEGISRRPVKITGMIGDSHAAAFGETCFQPGDVKATLGTGCSILMDTGERRVASRHGLVTTICWSLSNLTHYALEGIIVTAGATVKWLRDQMRLFEHTSETEALATAVPDNNGVYLVPAFSGLGAPHWKMDAKAQIVGLTFGADRRHVVHAALESIGYQIKDVIGVMEAEAGIGLNELMADGGITANGFVMQFIADLLGRPVSNIGIEDVSALGAAFMAGIGGGVYDGLDRLKELAQVQRCFSPSAQRERALTAYQGWLQAVKKL